MLKPLRLLAAISATSVSLISLPKAEAQEYPGCFMIAESGRYVNLNSVCSSEEDSVNFIETDFFSALEKIGVTVGTEECEPQKLGYYNSGSNQMVICSNNTNDETYLETLAHEGWHVVQDCVSGLDNPLMVPVTEKDLPAFQSMFSGLQFADLRKLTLYDSEDLPYEVEAFYMEKRPEEVLQGLKNCANSYSNSI